jgi:hypothetical protein
VLLLLSSSTIYSCNLNCNISSSHAIVLRNIGVGDGISYTWYSIMLLLFFPETQYTESTVVNRHKGAMIDNFRFWKVSGRGASKVHRQALMRHLSRKTKTADTS